MAVTELQQLVAGANANLTDKKPEHTHIVIDEVDEDSWGFAGMLTADFRKQEYPIAANCRLGLDVLYGGPIAEWMPMCHG